MPALFPNRWGQRALLVAVACLLFFPSLGAPSLWDIDEGNNAEAAREMLRADNWITPTFNFKLRVDKPALLYWLQIGSYQLFGIGEFAARLPSALASLLIVLMTWELGRRLFDEAAGLLAGLMLASAILFCGSAHFANPDALLNLCVISTFFCFLQSYLKNSKAWLWLTGLTTGLGFLAKGPVALVLPMTVMMAFLLWNRQWRRCLNPHILVAGVLFLLVGVPWYALVGSETKGEFLRGFFLTHNFGRFQGSMEGHGGPIFYHAISLLVGFLPWSVFLAPAVWFAVRDARGLARGAEPEAAPREELLPQVASRFLLCWMAVFFVFFSLSKTKLPGYILPLYPAVALMTARFLQRWWRGEIKVAGWVMPGSLLTLAGTGLAISVGFLWTGGVLPWPRLDGQRLPGLEVCAILGILPLLGAAGGWLCLRRKHRLGLVTVATVTGIAFTALLAAWLAPALDAHKAPRSLVQAAGVRRLHQEVRVGCYGWFQPSLVFYCQREVQQLVDEDEVRSFLQYPVPIYLFMPAGVWDNLQTRGIDGGRLLARQWDFYRNCEVVVIGNR